ncbi:Cif family virulence factor [Flaviaesturariibacter terrae]
MKQLLFAAAVLVSGHCIAQPAALQAMVGTERAFAAKSMSENTRSAFLAFMDTTAIMFRKDSFVNGYHMWLAREARPGKLDWKPVVAELAGSGDWGFTTGPWTFRPTEKDSATGRGHFFTIWHKGPDGQWRFLFDCGTEGGREPLDLLYPFTAGKTPGDEASLLQTDSLFTEALRSNARAAHVAHLSVTSMLCRNEGTYALTPGQQAKWLKALPATIAGSRAGYLLAPSRDLALVYGSMVTPKEGPQAFVRLWRHEPGGWRLAAEMLPL